MRSIGHVKKVREGVYRVIVSLGLDSKGRRIRRCETIKGTQRDAERRIAQLSHEYQTGQFVKPGKMTVGKFLPQWLQDSCKPNLSPKTYERYFGVVEKKLIPALGRVTLTQLKPEQVQAFYTDQINSGLKPTTVRYYHMTLHKALETAIKWGFTGRNVTNGLDIPRIHKREMQTWDEAEVAQFLKTAKSSQYYALFYTFLFTGVRRSEALALRWGDIDFLGAQMSITHGLHQMMDGT